MVAFVSEELSVHREQFILVNKAKPLDPRLINELLPEVDTAFPRDLSSRKIPSELVNLLQTSPDSPFRGLIKRPSEDSPTAVVTDLALVKAIRNSINSALGSLAPYKAAGSFPPMSMPCTELSSPIGALCKRSFLRRGAVRRPKVA